MPKYYFTPSAARPIVTGGHEFRFLICTKIMGRPAGVFEATTDEQIVALDEAVAKKRGVREIGQSEYEELKKKAAKTPQLRRLGGSQPRPVNPPQIQALAMDRAGVTSAASAEKPDEVALASAPSIASLTRVETVSPPKPFSQSDEKARKAAERQSKAKVRVARKAEAGP